MKEHPLLAAFAKLVADFLGNPENDPALLDGFLDQCALALLQGQLASSMRDNFEFEQIQYFTTQYLTTEDRQMLSARLSKAEQALALGAPVRRVFLREMPHRVTWFRSSIPTWAVAAELSDSIGTLINRDGRRFWLDIYNTPKLVRNFRFRESTRPSIILAPDAPLNITLQPINNPARFVSKVEMGEGTVWVQAKLFVASANELLYCGLRVASASLSFLGPSRESNQSFSEFLMVNDLNIKASLTLKLATSAPNIAAGTYGADARNANIQLPEALRLQFNLTTSTLMTVSGAVSWQLYGDQKMFKWTSAQASIDGFFNGVSIPMSLDSKEFVISQRQSVVLGLANSTQLSSGAWLVPMTKLDVPLIAASTGKLLVKTTNGLTATYTGVSDANGAALAQLQLNDCYILAEPSDIQIMATQAVTENAVQRFRLWQDVKKQGGEDIMVGNDVEMHYTRAFPLIYQCHASGIETCVSLTHCRGNLNRPVGAGGQPFELDAKGAILVRAFTEQHDHIVLFDERMLRENAQDPANPTFLSKAIALNNALMTVSPVNAFLLSGQLLPLADVLLDVSLNYAFLLLSYLPTLPDPYAANTGIFQWMGQQEARNGVFALGDIQRLLVATLRCKEMRIPSVRFIFGDMERSFNNMPLHLNPLLNLVLAQNKTNQTREARSANALARIRKRLNSDVQSFSDNYDLNLQVNDHFQHHHFFSLLDVSTAADWMGVDMGFIDDQFFFERSFEVRTDQNALSAEGMDVVASGRFVRLFTVPQISWEPVINTTDAINIQKDPPIGVLTFQDDGPPTLIGNTGSQIVPIAPLPLAAYIEEKYQSDKDFKAWSFFTLPFGMLGIARYTQEGVDATHAGATISIGQETFEGDIKAALQISTIGYENPIQGNRNFEGLTRQLSNLHDAQGNALILPDAVGNPGKQASILSETVTDIFNDEFGTAPLKQRGVPVERYDFSGYGANIFSNWLNPKAQIGQVSQAKFDVWRGRTAHEIIQVRSIIYPFCVHVVRTITMFRNSAGLVYRIDSGWRAESDGVYDFKTPLTVDAQGKVLTEAPAYDFHPGIVGGVFNVRNIEESSTIDPVKTTRFKTKGFYIDPNDGKLKSVGAGQNLKVELVPVYYDADVQMDDVVSGAVNGRVASKRLLGYLQKSPQGIVIEAEDFEALLNFQNGLGGPVDCLVNIGGSNQTMRMSRVEVQPSRNAANKIQFIVAAKGTPVLPKDGSWSVVQHKKTTKEVLPISDNVVPLIRRGLLNVPNNTHPFELANPADLFAAKLEDRAIQFAFLQNTDTQKVLFRNPFFEKGKTIVQSTKPDIADAFRLLNSKGIFPKLDNIPQLDFKDFDLNITEGGYKLLNAIDPNKAFEQILDKDAVIKFIDEEVVKIYAEYAKKDKDNNVLKTGAVNYDLDNTAMTARKWANKFNDITLVVDLLDMKRLFLIRGNFETEKGKAPAFNLPELEFGEKLKPVADILQILLLLNGENYGEAATKGLKIAMSNSPNNWEYKFQADKEIPVLRFPPPAADSPVAPLRLECYLKLGCYFNVGMPLLSGEGLPAPSGGAYVEFGAKLSVMCVSLAAATVYAVGTCALRIGADSVRGPNLYMKFGFGIELMVGLPVIGNVSVYFAAGVEISLDKNIITVGAFLLFRGRAELLGGLVTIQIQIEASGKIAKRISDAGDPNNPEKNRTDCIAQVTFSLDISIFLVINISFSKTFQENRQIA